jgi:predicted phage terminase large subunit-like protein
MAQAPPRAPTSSPPSLNAQRDARLLAGLARTYPEAYQRFTFGLAPRPHHLSWWGLLLALMRESSVAPAGVRGASAPPAPLAFDPAGLRERAEAGESEPPPTGVPRLYIVAPPGHAKSTLFSQVFPCWYLGHAPDQTVLMLTSSTTMARTYHDVVSSVLADSARHAAAFPEPACRPDARRGWSTDGLYLQGTPALQKEPAFRIAGWGASVLGARAHGIILDDALTQEESESALVTQRAWDHLQMTIENRLHPGGWLLGVGTRWTADDLIGRARRAGWPVYRYPALGPYPWGGVAPLVQKDGATGGVALWPRRFDVATLAAERRRIGGARFATVWQGVPTGVGAGVFRSGDWFRGLPAGFATLARRHTTLMYVDTAWSEKKTADYTASCTVGYDPDDQQRRLYFTGWWRHRVNEDGLAVALADHIVAMRPGLVGVEVPAFKQEATMELVRAVNQLLIGRHACAVVAVPVSTDKVVRARPHAAKAEGGLAFYDRAHPLWPVVEAELLGFPGAQHDDLVDAGSGAVTMALYGPDLLLRGQGAPGVGGAGRAIRFG